MALAFPLAAWAAMAAAVAHALAVIVAAAFTVARPALAVGRGDVDDGRCSHQHQESEHNESLVGRH